MVVTDVDSYSTYVGGSRAAVNEIIEHPELEALRVGLEMVMDTG